MSAVVEPALNWADESRVTRAIRYPVSGDLTATIIGRTWGDISWHRGARLTAHKLTARGLFIFDLPGVRA